MYLKEKEVKEEKDQNLTLLHNYNKIMIHFWKAYLALKMMSSKILNNFHHIHQYPHHHHHHYHNHHYHHHHINNNHNPCL